MGWSQQELAEYMNTTKSMISYYENDHGDMKESLIREFAEVLKTTYEFLACGVVNGAKLSGKAAEMLQIFPSCLLRVERVAFIGSVAIANSFTTSITSVSGLFSSPVSAWIVFFESSHVIILASTRS